MYNFVNTDLIEISDDLELEIRQIPNTNHKILVIDNFLKNPELLRYLAFKQTFEKTPCNQNSNPGWVSILNLKFNQILKTTEYLIENYYEVFSGEKFLPTFQLNLFEGGMPCKYSSIIPHTDPSFFAFQIYLNLPDECLGGTNFYKHIDSDSDYNVEYFDSEFKRTEKHWKIMNYIKDINQNDFDTVLDYEQIDSDAWEKIYEVEMKYNRFILYPSYIFHSAYIKKDWYKEIKRIGLVGFLK
mgnify:FL=1